MAPKPRGKRRTLDDGGVIVAGKNANGTGSIYFDRSRGCYRATYVDPTSGKRRTVSGQTKGEAERRRDERLEELIGSTPAGALGSDPSVEAVAEWWLENVAAVTVRPSTLHTYRKDVRRIADHLGATRIAELTSETVRSFLAELVRGELGEATRRNARARLRQIVEHAVDLGYLPSNPVTRVPNPKPPSEASRSRRVLTQDETRKLLGALEGKRSLDAAVALLFTSGLRVSEALGLAWSDLDLEAGTATVRRGCTYTGGGVGARLDDPKTTRTAGVHHLAPIVVELLKERRKQQAADRLAAGPLWETATYRGETLEMVFTTKVGALMVRQNVSNTIRRAAKAAGLDDPEGIGTHTGRRSVITGLFVAGLPIDDVARHVGHTDASTTAGYVQDLGDRPADTARKAAALFDPTVATG